MQQIDFKIKYKGFPYVSPPSLTVPAGTSVSPAWMSDSTAASGLDQLANFLTAIVPQIPTDISAITGIQNPAETGSDEWRGIGLDPDKFKKLDQLTKWLSEQLNVLNKITAVFTKVLSVMELFITGFNSFSSLISSAIKLAQKTLEDFSASGLGFGIYLNLIAPPAFLGTKLGEAWVKLDRGGFEGFLTRLQNSINDPTDKNRPTFTPVDYVGGWVVLLDSKSIDEIWSGLKQLAGLFNFMNLFGLNLAPPAPQNFKGYCSDFVDNTGGVQKQKFGIKLEWDNSYMSSAYLISRSKKPGGDKESILFAPTTFLDNPDTGDPGLITVAKDMTMQVLNGKDVILPKKEETVYRDSAFNSNKPKLIKATPGLTQSYIDYEVDMAYGQYFYVIQACDELGLLKGPYSLELAVKIKRCNDMYSMADVIEQPNGAYEFLSGGVGRVGSWTSIRASAMIPWMKDFIAFISETLLGALSGLTISASNSFSKFLNEIKNKVQVYIGIINVISYLVVSLKNFILGPQILMLNLKPVQGDMTTFVNRIRNAKLPVGDPGLSGADGISIGFVVAYGVSGALAGVDAKSQLTIAQEVMDQLTSTQAKTVTEKAQLATDITTAALNLANAKIAVTTQIGTEAIAATKALAMGKAFDFITGLFARKK